MNVLQFSESSRRRSNVGMLQNCSLKGQQSPEGPGGTHGGQNQASPCSVNKEPAQKYQQNSNDF